MGVAKKTYNEPVHETVDHTLHCTYESGVVTVTFQEAQRIVYFQEEVQVKASSVAVKAPDFLTPVHLRTFQYVSTRPSIVALLLVLVLLLLLLLLLLVGPRLNPTHDLEPCPPLLVAASQPSSRVQRP